MAEIKPDRSEVWGQTSLAVLSENSGLLANIYKTVFNYQSSLALGSPTPYSGSIGTAHIHTCRKKKTKLNTIHAHNVKIINLKICIALNYSCYIIIFYAPLFTGLNIPA